jgi:hypothetical protein
MTHSLTCAVNIISMARSRSNRICRPRAVVVRERWTYLADAEACAPDEYHRGVGARALDESRRACDEQCVRLRSARRRCSMRSNCLVARRCPTNRRRRNPQSCRVNSGTKAAPAPRRSRRCNVTSSSSDEAGAKIRIRAGYGYTIVQIANWSARIHKKTNQRLPRPRADQPDAARRVGFTQGAATRNCKPSLGLHKSVKISKYISSLYSQSKSRETHHPSRREESNSGGVPLQSIADQGLVCTNPSKT